MLSITNDLWTNVYESLGVQSYYALGVGIQKGLPFLLIPLLTRLYGNGTYASYVLFYASIQVFANLFSLATPHSAITFWFREEDKRLLTWTYMSFLAWAQIIIGGLLSGLAFYIYSQSFGKENAWLLTLFAFFFTFLYSFNVFLTGVSRACNYSKGYFYAQVIAGIGLVLGVVFLRQWPALRTLILVGLLSLALQNIYLMDALREQLHRPANWFDARLMKKVLAYSLPLIPHLESTLFLFWIDKYLVRLYFPLAKFSEFTISFQYAFAQGFFGQVLALYTFPLICRLEAEGEPRMLQSVIRTYNFLLGGLGVSWIGFLLLVHWTIMPLGIEPKGFVVLAIGFLLWNLASNYINVLWARLKTASTMVVSMGAAVILAGTVVIGCKVGAIAVCYIAHLLCAAAALTALIYFERGSRNQHGHPVETSGVTT